VKTLQDFPYLLFAATSARLQSCNLARVARKSSRLMAGGQNNGKTLVAHTRAIGGPGIFLRPPWLSQEPSHPCCGWAYAGVEKFANVTMARPPSS
jgi:hypothetical protein